MKRIGGAAGLLLVAAVAVGCGGSSKPAATTPTQPEATVASPGQTSPTVATPVSTGTGSALAAVDAQLSGLDGDVGSGQSGLAAQEADPTK